MPSDDLISTDDLAALRADNAQLREEVTHLSVKSRRYYEANHGVRFVLRDVEEQLAEMRARNERLRTLARAVGRPDVIIDGNGANVVIDAWLAVLEAGDVDPQETEHADPR